MSARGPGSGCPSCTGSSPTTMARSPFAATPAQEPNSAFPGRLCRSRPVCCRRRHDCGGRFVGTAPMKILLIDDDTHVLHTLSRILRDRGDTVLTAPDGYRGMRLFRAERPDVVITDIVMPGQAGLGTIREMRQERPEGKIIAISGGWPGGPLDILAWAASLGAEEGIAKPFEPQDLMARL